MPSKKQPDKQATNRKPNGQFAAGVSGNPNGRPKSRTLSEAYRAALKEPLPDGSGRTYADAVAEMLCKNAATGDVASARELADRTEGKPRQALDVAVNEPRALFESAVAAVVQKYGVTTDEATAVMLDVWPEAREWIN